ncbi:hypothetical protein IMZ48_07855 [Candidatus Bathyarchaeota archaeon]|nr:hypothetical protein [Candidatus Bathyarchaeota archaeon]
MLTITLLSPEGAAPLAPAAFPAPPRAGLGVFLTPPTGAAAVGRLEERRWDRRGPPPRWRVPERSSSRDLSSLPDMLLMGSGIKWME